MGRVVVVTFPGANYGANDDTNDNKDSDWNTKLDPVADALFGFLRGQKTCGLIVVRIT